MNFHISAALLLFCSGHFHSSTLSAGEQPFHMEETAGSSKNPDTSLYIIAQGSADSVLLRWAPSSLSSWHRWKKAGCILQRREIAVAPGPDSGRWEQMTRRAIKPWSLSTVASRSDGSDFWLGAAMSAVYLERLNLPRSGERETAALDEQGAVTLALLAADRSSTAAAALGLRFVDREVRHGKLYEYRVFIAGGTEAGDTAYVQCTALDDPHPGPAQLTAEGGDGRVILRWQDSLPDRYGFFHVFRSDDEGRTYHSMTGVVPVASDMTGDRTEFSAAMFIDTAVVNGRTYRYRVRGLTPFAGMSEAAEIAASPRDLTPPPAPVLKEPKYVAGMKVEVAWDFHEEPPGEPAAFRVSRSSTENGEYRIISGSPLAAESRRFIDNNPDETETYYIVSSIDGAGNEAASWPKQLLVIDSIAPSVPTGLVCSMDTAGVVHLEWDPNPEKDIYAYQLFRSYKTDGEMTLLTPLFWKKNAFTDTVDIENGSQHVDYALLALDKNGNMSNTCDRVSVPIPDRIPPLRPVFTDVQVQQRSITLTWVPAPDLDVAEQLLYRSEGETGEAILYRSFPPGTESFYDTSFVAETEYRYKILARDLMGNTSEADAVRAELPRGEELSAVRNLAARYDKEKNAVTLTWDRPEFAKGNNWYVLSRAPEGEPMRMYRSIAREMRQFTDDDLTDAPIHTYAISVMSSSGAESPPSMQVKVETKR